MKTVVAVFIASSVAFGQLLGEDVVEPKSGKKETSVKTEQTTNVTPDEVEKLMKSEPKPLIIDVRTAEEFANGHIAGAKNIDINDPAFAKKVAALDQKAPVIVHCAAGRRGAKALPTFSHEQFPAVYHMNGGLNAWKAAGKPIEK